MKRPPVEPERAARFVVETLQREGYTAYYAGGCVRDRILGRPPNDYDVATNAEPSRVRELFHRTLAVGEQFGIVIVRYKGQQIEVATFRADGDYSDGRRPDVVHYTTDPAEDAQRRDFSVNGLFYDPIADEIHDFVGGREDIAQQRIRAIGDPHERFHEDRLRILRAPRFAAVLGFGIDPATAAAAREHAPEITSSGVSPERIRVELLKLLKCPGRALGWRLLEDLGLLPIVWPAAQEEPEPTARALESLPAQLGAFGEGLPWAVPLWTKTPAEARASLDALRCSKKEREGAALLLEDLEQARRYEELSEAERKRLLATDRQEARLLVVSADAAAREEGPELCERLRADHAAWSALEGPATLGAPQLVGGRDLQQAGLRPGPTFAPVLRQVYDAQLEGRVATREEALALALELAGDA